MGDYITPEDYSRAVEAMGLKGAQDWVRKHNITIADNASGGVLRAPEARMEDEGELSPIGGIEEDDTESTLNVAPSAGGLTSLDAFNAAQKVVTDRIRANINLFTEAQQRLRDRRVGPSNAEKWFAIAAALGKPTRTGSFGESLGSLGEVLGEQGAARRKAEEERDALLEQYGLKIGTEELRLAQANAAQAGQLYRAQLAANKPKNPYTGAVWSEEEGRWIMRPGAEGGPPVLSPEKAAELARDPKNRGMKFYTTDGRPMEIK